MPNLDQQIAEAHSDLEAVEQSAKQLEARLRGIPGLERLVPSRTYGQPVDVDAIKSNLTARSLINSYDEQLASYLGINSGAAKVAQERREAREQAVEAMRIRTEQLAAENAFRLQGRDYQQTLDMLLSCRDRDPDPNTVGPSTEFIEWVWRDQIPRLAANPFYRQQIADAADAKERTIHALEQEIQRKAGSLQEEASCLAIEREKLLSLLQEVSNN